MDDDSGLDLAESGANIHSRGDIDIVVLCIRKLDQSAIAEAKVELIRW